MISACLHFRCAPVLLRHGYAPKRCGKAGCDQSHGSNHTVAAAEALAPVLDRKWLLKAYESQVRKPPKLSYASVVPSFPDTEVWRSFGVSAYRKENS